MLLKSLWTFSGQFQKQILVENTLDQCENLSEYRLAHIGIVLFNTPSTVLKSLICIYFSWGVAQVELFFVFTISF